MLLRTEELGHVPPYEFKTLSPFKTTAIKLASFIFFCRFQVQEVIKPGSQCGKPSAMHKWQRTATNRESGVLDSHTDLRSPPTVTLLPEMRGNDKAPQSVDSTRTFTLTFKQKLTSTCHRSNNTGHEIPLEEDSLFPFPRQIKHRKLPGKEPNTNRGVKHLWRWSHSEGQRGGVSFGTAPGWRDDFKHTLVCKRHSHIVYL